MPDPNPVVAAANCDLVCEGGGVKGVGLAGAYSVLEEHGYRVQNVAGTSAGAITAALIAAGYTAEELKKIVFELDFLQFEDKGWEDRIPLFGKGVSLLSDQGIYEGNRFREWIGGLLEEKHIKTFADLRTGDEDPRFAYRLQVIASDVSARRLLVLPRDAAILGIEPDELEVALAVRMSMSIPIFFEPVRIENKQTNHEHLIVDGGMLSNYPLWLFDCDTSQIPDWPTFGLLLVEPEPKTPITARLPEPQKGPHGARGLISLLSALVHTMMEAHERMYVEKEQFARTIPIKTLGVGTTEFNLSEERKLALYNSGRTAAEEFLATWNFDAYVEEYRKGKQHPRRDEVAAKPEPAQVG
jgi:NTE family protein